MTTVAAGSALQQPSLPWSRQKLMSESVLQSARVLFCRKEVAEIPHYYTSGVLEATVNCHLGNWLTALVGRAQLEQSRHGRRPTAPCRIGSAQSSIAFA